MNEAAPAAKDPIASLNERINKILEARYDFLTATTNPGYPPFSGFGSADEIRSLLVSQGVNLDRIRIDVSESGRRLRFIADDKDEPVYDSYFASPEQREEERRAIDARFEEYGEE
jgi:hypothetical protein